MTDVSLIIPAFNEAGIIVSTVRELDDFMRTRLKGRPFEIIVVDDGSTDGMADRLAEVKMKAVKVARHKRNRGRGAAIRTGFAASSGAYVLTLDSDLSYSPEHIPMLLSPLESGEADVTLASAYHPEGTVRNVPFTRAKLSKWGNRVLSAGVHGQLHTLTCMVRGYRREVIDELELIGDGKDLHIEIIQKANLFGYKIAEIPATLDWRDKARAKRIGKGWRFPLFAMSGTIASHLVYNYLLRPGSTLVLPVMFLGLVVLIGAIMLATTWIATTVSRLGEGFFFALYSGLRDTLISGALTLTIMGGSLFILLIFLAFYFQSHQSKKQYEELYILLARANGRLKRLERDTKG
ncbi:MAG: glycosyltransferase family 2 protein [Rhizobiaceae bacterium]|nr:glycosyltransferase family 2 protein [Rhizobiaceae bacterium]